MLSDILTDVLCSVVVLRCGEDIIINKHAELQFPWKSLLFSIWQQMHPPNSFCNVLAFLEY
jgi:hypothetical protein